MGYYSLLIVNKKIGNDLPVNLRHFLPIKLKTFRTILLQFRIEDVYLLMGYLFTYLFRASNYCLDCSVFIRKAIKAFPKVNLATFLMWRLFPKQEKSNQYEENLRFLDTHWTNTTQIICKYPWIRSFKMLGGSCLKVSFCCLFSAQSLWYIRADLRISTFSDFSQWLQEVELIQSLNVYQVSSRCLNC